MKKNLLLILAMLLVVALAGCAPATPAAVTDPDAGPPAAVAEEPVELSWIMGNPGPVPPDPAMVEERLNEISVAQLNVKVTTL